ncbi:MAG TPA: tetratricopeptide repeat protein [Candidatus Deferrimicrobiaceae bacterium]
MNIIRRCCLLSLLLVLGCAGVQPTTIDKKAGANSRMQMGISYLRQNNIPMAMRELDEASRLDPDNPEVDLGFGFAYQARGEHDVAERHFRNAIRKRPGYPEAYNGLGTSLSFQGKSDEALKAFETAAKNVYYLTPEMAWFNMGEEYRRRKNYPKAESMYGKAVSSNDKFFDAHLARAAVRVEEKRLEEAASGLEGAVSRNPGFIQGQVELGRIYMRLGRNDAARKVFKDASAGTGDPAIRRLAAEYLNLLGGKKK